MIFFPLVLTGIFSRELSLKLYQSMPSSVLFSLIVFFPLNFDIFTRESQLDMLDYLAMNMAKFKTIYKARIFASAILMGIPFIIGSLILSMITLLPSSEFSLIRIIGEIVIIFLFFCFWFLIALITVSITELKQTATIIRVIPYFVLIIMIFAPLILLNRFMKELSSITGIFLGLTLFENILVSLVTILMGCLVNIMLGKSVIRRRINKIVNSIEILSQEDGTVKTKHYITYYSVVKTLRSFKSLKWQSSILILSCLPYLLLVIIISDPLMRIRNLLTLQGVHFFFILLYVLLTRFPLIIGEREFNMEELILSRISSSHYFFEKVAQLFYRIVSPLVLPIILILIVSLPLYESTMKYQPLYICLSKFYGILFLQSFYFISILLFIWRLFPVKNLLQSSLLSIFGLEALGLFVSQFINPSSLINPGFSPLLSNLFLFSYIISAPALVLNLALSMLFVLTSSLLLASLVLVKSLVHFI
jgi:hypothetical protein